MTVAFNTDALADALSRGIRDVVHYQWDPNETIYIIYGSWDDVLCSYRATYDLYAKSKSINMPKLSGWRIELDLPIGHQDKHYEFVNLLHMRIGQYIEQD